MEVALEFVADARGRHVVPVRWHCRITSLKMTSHKSFFDEPEVKTSLRRLKDDLPCTFPFPLTTGGGDDEPFGDGEPLPPELGGGGHCCSLTSNLEDFGSAS